MRISYKIRLCTLDNRRNVFVVAVAQANHHLASVHFQGEREGQHNKKKSYDNYGCKESVGAVAATTATKAEGFDGRANGHGYDDGRAASAG